MAGSIRYDLEGQSAIVTGSTSGIGRGIARAFAEADGDVVINSRTEADVRDVADELDDCGSGSVVGVTADVQDPESIETLVERAVAEFGTIEILVNNAAIWPMEDAMIETDLQDWDTTMAVNVRAHYYASKLVAEHMKASDVDGRIVSVTSQTGDRRTGNRGLYGVSNTAINGLVWRMAGELAEHGIRMNAVSTDLVETRQVRLEARAVSDATGQTVDEVLDEWGADLPLGRIGQPSDVADAVLFLTSSMSDYVVGNIVRVAGGGNLR